MTKYVRYGASPRAAQALVLAGKINAINRGQAFVSIDDIRAAALPALRHRILLNFEGEADEVNTDYDRQRIDCQHRDGLGICALESTAVAV